MVYKEIVDAAVSAGDDLIANNAKASSMQSSNRWRAINKVGLVAGRS